MTTVVVRAAVLCLSCSIAPLCAPAQAQSRPGPDAPPTVPLTLLAAALNIHVDPLLRPLVGKLLVRSPTFRRQWQAIGASPIIEVWLLSTPVLRETPSARARSEISRFRLGAIRAVVELPSVVDLTELLPHELEHVLEQIEGLDLRALARDGASGVQEIARGVYETARARGAGLDVLREVYGEPDPALGKMLRGVQRAFKALVTDGRAAESAPAGAPPDHRRRTRAVPGGHPSHKQ